MRVDALNNRTADLAPPPGSAILARLVLAGVNILAWLLYAAGLIAPLTPSEGMPRLGDFLIFLVGPIALLIFVAMRSQSRIVKGLVFLQVAVVVGFTSWLILA